MAMTTLRFGYGIPIADLLGDDVPVREKNTMPAGIQTNEAPEAASIDGAYSRHATFVFATPTVNFMKLVKIQKTTPPPSSPHLTGTSELPSDAGVLRRSSPNSSPRNSHLQKANGIINVFYERVMESCLYAVPYVSDDRSLSTLSNSVFEFFAVLPENQLLTVMHSTDVVTYAIRLITQASALSIIIPHGACVVLALQPSSRANLVLRRAWPAASCLRKKRPIDADDESMQDSVRERMTRMLSQKGKGVNLQIISELSQFSKAALSQWRRNQYKGNTQAIAIAVSEALDDIESGNDKFGSQSKVSAKKIKVDPYERRDSTNSFISAVSTVSVQSTVPSSAGTVSEEEDWGTTNESETLNTLVEGMVFMEMMRVTEVKN